MTDFGNSRRHTGTGTCRSNPVAAARRADFTACPLRDATTSPNRTDYHCTPAPREECGNLLRPRQFDVSVHLGESAIWPNFVVGLLEHGGYESSSFPGHRARAD